MVKDGIKGIVKKLGGTMDYYSGAALIPVKGDMWGHVLETLAKEGSFTKDYELNLIPEYLFLRPRDMKDKKVPHMINYLKEKIEKAAKEQ